MANNDITKANTSFGGYAMTALVKFPCQNCTKRTLNCHDTCEEYIKCQQMQKQVREKKKFLKTIDRRSLSQKKTLRMVFGVESKEVINEAKKRYGEN